MISITHSELEELNESMKNISENLTKKQKIIVVVSTIISFFFIFITLFL